MAEYSSLSNVPRTVGHEGQMCKIEFVDKISMVSSLVLTYRYMHLRLEELFGGEEWLNTVFTSTTHFVVVHVGRLRTPQC